MADPTPNSKLLHLDIAESQLPSSPEEGQSYTEKVRNSGSSATPQVTIIDQCLDPDTSLPNDSTTPRSTEKLKPELLVSSPWQSNRNSQTGSSSSSTPTVISLQGPPRKEASTEKRRFAPQLLETYRQVRSPQGTESTEEIQKPRRFVPQLIQVAKRSRRAGDTQPAITHADRTDVTPLESNSSRKLPVHSLPVAPNPSPIASPFLSSTEARKRGIPLQRRRSSNSSAHSRSFRAPCLDTIESSESSPSYPGSPYSPGFEHATRARESIDKGSSGYLLALAAETAERQLREQGLSAFPNDDRHEPFQHYVNIRETPTPSSRGSQYELGSRRYSTNWELKEMKRHHQKLESDREKERRRREARRKLQKQLDDSSWGLPTDIGVPSTAVESDRHEMSRMHKMSRPPMLGKDIIFPRSDSPDPARFDVTQGPESLKKAMCYLTEQTDEAPSGGGLWTAKTASTNGSASPSASRNPSRSGGLWGGSCLDSGPASPSGPPGIITPRFDDEPSSYMEPAAMLRHLPPSPPPSNSDMTSLDEQLELEYALDTEFDDRFVTQVYNYLSLGYPAVACDYDEELSKISRMALSDLRRDDTLPTATRGYIRFGEDEDAAADAGITEDMCARWKALRLYVHEWARQQPRMAKLSNVEGYGVGARKGSWGF